MASGSAAMAVGLPACSWLACGKLRSKRGAAPRFFRLTLSHLPGRGIGRAHQGSGLLRALSAVEPVMRLCAVDQTFVREGPHAAQLFVLHFGLSMRERRHSDSEPG